jgi:hypothetical protein
MPSAPCGAAEARTSLRTMAGLVSAIRDMSAQQIGPGALQLRKRTGLGGHHQLPGLVVGPGLQIGRRRRQQPVAAPHRVGGEQHRLLQERRGGGRTAACLGPAGRPLQVRGDLLVRAVGGLSPVPGPPVGVGDRIGRRHQRQVHRLSFRQ